jgi:DNA mismatch repair ATPase MutS
MKAYLLYRDRDFDWQEQPPWGAKELIQDLGLQTLFDAMAKGDKFLLEATRKVLQSSVSDLDTIVYRQEILRDCLANGAVVRGIYDIAVQAIERERKDYWRLSTRSPRLNLSRAIDVLEMFSGMLARLRGIAELHARGFQSEGFTTLFATLRRELTDDYLAIVRDHLKRLRFQDGVLVSAELGKGLKGANYVLRKPYEPEQGWVNRIFGRRAHEYTFHLHPRDESGFNALSDLRDQGINTVANALAQSSDHVLSFFQFLRGELAFYLGCLNLHEQLSQKSEPTCFPVPMPLGERWHTARGLYDVCLALSQDGPVVGNDLNADGKGLVIITGANQGGKSTFLRSIGLAQLMMQCGMFVPAESFRADVCLAIFTHFKREEDAAMESGKLDEELRRMSEIADHLTRDSVVLFNESFTATNAREGSEIARQIVSALLEKGVKVFFVTHLYEFARGFFEKGTDEAIFLRAERRPDGVRTFKLLEGAPLRTSHGEDLYHRIFNSAFDDENRELRHPRCRQSFAR